MVDTRQKPGKRKSVSAPQYIHKSSRYHPIQRHAAVYFTMKRPHYHKLLCNAGHSEEKLGFTFEDIIICLRLALLNEAKEVRAAGLRALRYLIRDSSILQKVLKLKVDYLIARCIDIQQSNEVERTQALRLVRKVQ
ncbi:rapamycin-insensitive companion of mTOR-like [Sphaerodactylus townsendi]|uniref:rapamycin-insensitive companion of mTOR-like n=1 Tax=Sphaerodactylus townsendi TaxID=933632 RepID=UPI002027445D|nr:rapamycin-insensitive companion of mTOR-like [Sphaerodactylus townsendi]